MTYVNKSSVLAIGIVLIILSISVVIARFNVRRSMAGFGLDDWLCIPALVLVVAECCIMIIGSATNSVGQHDPPNMGIGELTYDGADLMTLQKLEFSFNLIHIVTLSTLKLSLLFFYRRIFRGKVFDITSWTLIGMTLAWAVTFVVALPSACGTSIRAYFSTLGVLTRKCTPLFHIWISLVVLDVFVDLSIMVLPVPLIWTLQMPVRRKITVTLTFLIGAIAIACGITRMVIYAELFGSPLLMKASVADVHSTDYIGLVSIQMFWALLEMGVGIIAVCLPVLRPLLRGWSPKTLLHSLRSVLSGGSRGSKYGVHRPSSLKRPAKTESETSLADVKRWGTTKYPVQHQAYVMAQLPAQSDARNKVPGGAVWVDRDFTQTIDSI